MSGVDGMKLRLTDVTLRDGSHAFAHQFTSEHVRAVVAGLDSAGVPVIEVTHGDGLAGSSIQYGFSRENDLDLISTARETAQNAKIAALMLPGIATRKDIKDAVERGVDVLRIATQCTEADVSEQHFGMAKELGLETVGFLMMAHMRGPEELAEQALLMESYGADCVYVVDSAGAMLPSDAHSRVQALREALSVQVGYHAHNNLGLAIGNTLAAIEAGADQIDGATRGFGAGAGNASTELLAAVLDKAGFGTGLDVFKLLDLAEFTVAQIQTFQPMPDRDSITIGYAGVYSTFLLHAKRIGKQLGVDPRDILVELGRRQAVAGQEDWILRVAVELSQAQRASAGPAA